MAGNKKKTEFKYLLLFFVIAIVAIVFWSSSIILLIGMLPSCILWLVDKSVHKSKTLTVAAMNFIGCFSYLIDIWNASSPLEQSLRFLTDPMTLIVIYSMALFGYIINYITVLVVSSHIHEKTEKRIETIENEKRALEKRWGKKVNGEIPLDDRGFPIESKQSDDQEDDSEGNLSENVS